jgi:predicted NAD-dependent protein-ADP-ribosyltransferase YbiA (DUF1768 family)
VLGDVEAPVVASAFGYFEPGLVRRIWDSGRQIVAPREAARAHLSCAHRFGRERYGGVGDLSPFCAAAEAVVAAADPAGLALFAGIAAEPLPEDPPARAAQLLSVLRELRGSTHLLAVVATGLSPRVAHYLGRPDFFSSFGWKEDDVPVVDEAARARYTEARVLTDRLLLPAYGALDDRAAADFADGVAAMAAALASGD